MKFVYLLASVCLVGCATEDGSSSKGGKGGKADDGGESIALQIGMCPAGGNGDGYRLSDDARVEDHRLLVSARYAGGCEKHTFTACWDGLFLESFPVQTQIRLIHDAHGDACEALVSSELAIDLTGLSKAYRQAYQTVEGSIFVNVEDVSARYDFRALNAAELASAFALVARGANYTSESDSEPTFLSAAGTTIDAAFIEQAFGAQMELAGDEVMEITRGAAVSEMLAGWAEYEAGDEDYIVESAQAWGRVKRLLEANLVELTFARIGPADEDGTLAVDAGAYQLVVLGKSIDGKVVGFFVVSVET